MTEECLIVEKSVEKGMKHIEAVAMPFQRSFKISKANMKEALMYCSQETIRLMGLRAGLCPVR